MPRKPSPSKAGSKKILAGRYRVERPLGHGGGGSVYLVRDSLMGDRPLALKMVELPKRGQSPLLADLKNEFATLSELSHRNLARVYDFGGTEREMYFTSEWVEGKDVLAASASADFNAIFEMILQMLRGVDFLHRRGVLHLDLKPANILVTDPAATGELSVKLIDFGIAQWKQHGRILGPGFHGTPPFAAPEMIEEKEPGPAADIYSLGMILHLIFANRFPFSTQNPFEILMRQTVEDPLPLGKIHPALPESFSEVVRRMVARDPARRLQNAAEVLDAINRSLDERFSLRSPTAPIHFLEESDPLFYPELFREWLELFSQPAPLRIALVGPPGSGKTHLLRRLKAGLQLVGARALYFEQVSELKDWMDARGPEDSRTGQATRPIFLDAILASELPSLGELLAKLPGPVLLADRDFPSDARVSGWKLQHLGGLGAERLDAWLRAEIRGVPPSFSKELVAAFGPLTPTSFEDVLQACREAAWLAWDEAGWSWCGESEADLLRIVREHEQRWEERKRSVGEILKVSRLGLPARVLEGMLGLTAGALEDSLHAWVQEGYLAAAHREGGLHYLSRETAAGISSPSGAAVSDPLWLAEQLKSLYDRGMFSVGVAWIEALVENPQELPTPVALWSARHLAAEGLAEPALKWLDRDPPTAPGERGLFHEIRARAFHLLGQLEQASASIAEAEAFYRMAQDEGGVARAYNLRGTLAKVAFHPEEAAECYTRAAEVAEAAGDLYCAGIARTNLATVYQEVGKIDLADQAYQKAWEISEKFFHPLLAQTLHHNWINLLHHMGRSAEAEEACYRWLSLAVRHGYREQQALALNYLAIFSGQKEHRELQGSYLNQAIGLLDPNKFPRLLAQVLANRAFLHWSCGRYLPAQLDAEAARKYCRAWVDDPLFTWIFLTLGLVHRDRPKPDLEVASNYLHAALENVLKNRNRQMRWEVEYHLGLLEKLRGDLPKAREHFLEATHALEEFAREMPERLKESYLRDRKWDRVQKELEDLKGATSLEKPPDNT